ncbi:hypothetical protein [Hyalangium rubrum]|uniref:FHA domain-containing protein n=1 Tax=Hyalangium rubrum TaxID=3103134 RepID=A0ABU5GXR0_9BACT|nr:hypothetical protein [Hyalangium sp. s54d21]MDY7225826.1 hypothetical protein [Hyalangium sp. s54d21]
MNNPSPEKLKAAIQALSQVRAVEGPPGDNGQRSVWHMSPQGAELLSLVDLEGRVQRQELTLLDDHYVWTSGEGLKTGRLENEGGAKAPTAAAIVHTDSQLMPVRLVRGAVALATYDGEDRYILHIKRVLALAREGLEMRDSSLGVASEPAPEPVVEPPTTATPLPTIVPVPPEAPESSKFEGLMMIAVLLVGLVAGIALLVWLT